MIMGLTKEQQDSIRWTEAYGFGALFQGLVLLFAICMIFLDRKGTQWDVLSFSQLLLSIGIGGVIGVAYGMFCIRLARARFRRSIYAKPPGLAIFSRNIPFQVFSRTLPPGAWLPVPGVLIFLFPMTFYFIVLPSPLALFSLLVVFIAFLTLMVFYGARMAAAKTLTYT